jgi:hypothetical protein
VRTISPKTTLFGAQATASSGALAITIDRLVPALGIPGVPALELPGAPPVILGTPDLPTHTEILLGEARVGVNATAIPSLGGLVPEPILPDLGPGPIVSGDEFSSVTGAGSSAQSALNAPAQSQSGGAQVALQPTGATGKGVPIGWVIVGIFGAFAASGPLLGYARWQLLEGRHR